MTTPQPPWTYLTHPVLREALAKYAELTGDNELYAYTSSPNGKETRVTFRGFTALSYREAIEYVYAQTMLASKVE